MTTAMTQDDGKAGSRLPGHFSSGAARWLAGSCCALAAWLLLAPGAQAGTLTESDRPDCDYAFRGEIVPGDAALLGRIPPSYDGFILCMDSPGGSVGEAMEMFREVAGRNILTRVPNGWRCESSCATVFMAGSFQTGVGVPVTYRGNQLEPGGILGFHAPSLLPSGGGSFSAEQVAASFDVAIRAAGLYYRASLQEEDEWRSFNEYLYARILETPSDDMYRIDRIADAVLADIHLGVVTMPAEITEAHVVNLCDSAWLKQAPLQARMPEGDALDAYARLRYEPVYGESVEGEEKPWEAEYRGVTLERDGDRVVGYVTGYALRWRGSGPQGFACRTEFLVPDPSGYPRLNESEEGWVTEWYRGNNVAFYEYTIMSLDEADQRDWHLPMDPDWITSNVSAPLWMLHAPDTRLDSLVPQQR